MPFTSAINRRFCIAPMMEWSDRHCRYFWRLLTQHSLLYTEMVTTGALLRGDAKHHLQFNREEHPVALQLGGSDPKELSICAKLAEDCGYDEVNLNCGCPSDRVQNGRFGACLMAEADLVAECVQAMANAVKIPVTVKNRIGIDDQEDFTALSNFVTTVASAGCTTFIVHARKAWLQGLSPKENREIPPLQYELVHQLKRENPQLEIIINGGFTDLESATAQLQWVDGVMMGREAYHNPFILTQVDALFYNQPAAAITREKVLQQFAEYCASELASGNKLSHMARHILGLYHGQPGGKKFRRYLSENMHRADATVDVLQEAVPGVQARM